MKAKKMAQRIPEMLMITFEHQIQIIHRAIQFIRCMAILFYYIIQRYIAGGCS